MLTGTLAADAFAASGKLVLYTSQPNKDAQQTVDAFRAVHPDVEVEWIRDGTTKVMAKLRAEFAADSHEAGRAADCRRRQHGGAQVRGAPDGPRRCTGRTRTTRPSTTWTAPTSPRSSSPPASSTTRAPPCSPPNGRTWSSPRRRASSQCRARSLRARRPSTWRLSPRIRRSAGPTTSSSRPTGSPPKGETGAPSRPSRAAKSSTAWWWTSSRSGPRPRVHPSRSCFPSQGVSAVTEPVAILSTARNPEAAKAFVDFLLSPDGQALAASQGLPGRAPRYRTSPRIPAARSDPDHGLRCREGAVRSGGQPQEVHGNVQPVATTAPPATAAVVASTAATPGGWRRALRVGRRRLFVPRRTLRSLPGAGDARRDRERAPR